MKSAKSLQSLPAVALAVLLLVAPCASAQRRRARTARRTSVPPPAAKQQPAARGPVQPPAASEGRRPRPQPARPAPQVARELEDEKGASEIDRPLEEIVAAEGYALYIELRALGQLVRSKEMNELIEMIRLVGGGVKEVTDYVDFYTAHAEQLDDVSTYTLLMPTRAGLPQFIGAYQFPSVEAAKIFEPKVRGAMEKYERGYKDARAPGGAGSPAPAGVAAETNKPGAPPTPPAPQLFVKRYGRLILASAEPFTLKGLKGKDEPPLAQNARLQSLRSRLSSEPVFFYFDVKLLEKNTEIEREKMEQTQQATVSGEASVAGPGDPAAQEEIDREMHEAMARAEAKAKAVEAARANDRGNSGDMKRHPEDEDSSPPEEETGNPAVTVETTPMPTLEGQTEHTQPGGEAELSSRGDHFLMSMIFGMGMSGMPRWPEAVGVAIALDKDSFVVRALLVNSEAGHVPIPFLPMLISGPTITPQASQLAPADTDIYVSASLDLTQMYDRMFASMNESFSQEAQSRKASGEKVSDETDSAEATIAAAEKLMGFKIKDELLPALGNEVAVSLPLKWFTGERGYNQGFRPEAGEGRQAPVVLVSLNNSEAMRRMLPRVLELAGMKALTAAEQTVSHGGVQIHVYGSIAVAYVGNFMALSTNVDAIKRLIDSGSSQGPLAADERFRAATSWSPRQKLAEAYVSRALAESLLEEITKWADPKDAEVQQLLTRLNIRPEPAAYAVTDEGGLLLHELRLPTAIIKYFAAGSALERKVAPIKQGENSALSTLATVREMQRSYKEGKGKGSYATLEELSAPHTRPEAKFMRNWEHPLSKVALERLGYRFELTAAGDRYTVTATPKEFGKNGRRSFYLDETGIIRGADHAGEPATANDPPVD